MSLCSSEHWKLPTKMHNITTQRELQIYQQALYLFQHFIIDVSAFKQWQFYHSCWAEDRLVGGRRGYVGSREISFLFIIQI